MVGHNVHTLWSAPEFKSVYITFYVCPPIFRRSTLWWITSRPIWVRATRPPGGLILITIFSVRFIQVSSHIHPLKASIHSSVISSQSDFLLTVIMGCSHLGLAYMYTMCAGAGAGAGEEAGAAETHHLRSRRSNPLKEGHGLETLWKLSAKWLLLCLNDNDW